MFLVCFYLLGFFPLALRYSWHIPLYKVKMYNVMLWSSYILWNVHHRNFSYYKIFLSLGWELSGKSHGQKRNLAIYSPWRCKELDMTEHKVSHIIIIYVAVMGRTLKFHSHSNFQVYSTWYSTYTVLNTVLLL